jgi:hypothetical protein
MNESALMSGSPAACRGGMTSPWGSSEARGLTIKALLFRRDSGA